MGAVPNFSGHRSLPVKFLQFQYQKPGICVSFSTQPNVELS